jgi:hypothetical protein
MYLTERREKKILAKKAGQFFKTGQLINFNLMLPLFRKSEQGRRCQAYQL